MVPTWHSCEYKKIKLPFTETITRISLREPGPLHVGLLVEGGHRFTLRPETSPTKPPGVTPFPASPLLLLPLCPPCSGGGGGGGDTCSLGFSWLSISNTRLRRRRNKLLGRRNKWSHPPFFWVAPRIWRSLVYGFKSRDWKRKLTEDTVSVLFFRGGFSRRSSCLCVCFFSFFFSGVSCNPVFSGDVSTEHPTWLQLTSLACYTAIMALKVHSGSRSDLLCIPVKKRLWIR